MLLVRLATTLRRQASLSHAWLLLRSRCRWNVCLHHVLRRHEQRVYHMVPNDAHARQIARPRRVVAHEWTCPLPLVLLLLLLLLLLTLSLSLSLMLKRVVTWWVMMVFHHLVVELLLIQYLLLLQFLFLFLRLLMVVGVGYAAHGEGRAVVLGGALGSLLDGGRHEGGLLGERSADLKAGWHARVLLLSVRRGG